MNVTCDVLKIIINMSGIADAALCNNCFVTYGLHANCGHYNKDDIARILEYKLISKMWNKAIVSYYIYF